MVKLDELLGGENIIKILVFFLRKPSIKISQTDLRNKIQIAKATLIKWLNLLVKENLIQFEKIGVTKLYQLNKDNAINKQLKILDNIASLTPAAGISKKYGVKIYLYGSAARGEDTEESDIDLLIIGKIQKEQIIGEINKISENAGRDVKIQIFTPLDWSKMSRKDPSFYERVEKDKKELA